MEELTETQNVEQDKEGSSLQSDVDALVSYLKSDVVTVCKAFLEDYTYHNDGDYGDQTYECLHCGEKTKPYVHYSEIESIRHGLNCPVLIARDLLTGS